MNALIRGWRYAAVAALIHGLPLAAACSSDPPTGSGEQEENGDSELAIEFPEMYSAYTTDGDHEFQVPAKIDGVKNAKWSADPADAVSIAKQSDGTVMITMKKAVDLVTIKAKAGSLTATAKLHILGSTEDVWQQGKERYTNGVVFQRPDGGRGGQRPDGGWSKGERKVDPKLACTNCHAKGGKGTDVEHTPTQTGGYSDDQLIDIFTNAKKPDGVEMRTMKAEQWEKIHKWSMEEDEKQGLVVYLRSLTPESQGVLDFGGGIFGRGGKGGKHRPDDDSTSDKGSTSDKPADDKGATN